jgi:hypothetical protein
MFCQSENSIGARRRVVGGHQCRNVGVRRFAAAYFIAVDTEVKVVFKLVPRAVTAVMIATEMPAAMRPYSMAVAPDWSRKKRTIFDI